MSFNATDQVDIDQSFSIPDTAIRRLVDAIPASEQVKRDAEQFLETNFTGTEVKEGVLIQKDVIALILVARELLLSYAHSLIEGKPLESILSARIDVAVMDLEETSGDKIQARLMGETNEEGATVTLSTGILDNLGGSVQAVEKVVIDLIGENSGLNIYQGFVGPEFEDDLSIGQVQLSLLRQIHPDAEDRLESLYYSEQLEPTATDKFSDIWNNIVRTAMRNRFMDILEERINDDLTSSDRGTLQDEIELMVNSTDFTLLNPDAVIRFMRSSETQIRDTILDIRSSRVVKLKLSEVGAEKISERDIQDILSVIRYPGTFQGLTNVIETRVRRLTEKQLRTLVSMTS